MRSIIVVLYLLVACANPIDNLPESVQESHSIVPDQGCPGGSSGITQFAAAQQIAAATCETFGQDGNTLCMAPIVVQHCPDVASCQRLLCNDQLVLLQQCVQQTIDVDECATLFPAAQFRSRSISGALGQAISGSFTRMSVAPGSVLEATSAATFVFQLPLDGGSVIGPVTISVFKTGGFSGILQARVELMNPTTIISSSDIELLGTTSQLTLPNWQYRDIPINVTPRRLSYRDQVSLIVRTNGSGIAIGDVSVSYIPPRAGM